MLLQINNISNLKESAYQNNKLRNDSKNIPITEPKADLVSFRGKWAEKAAKTGIVSLISSAIFTVAAAVLNKFSGDTVSKVNYKDFVKPHKFDFPEGSTITLPGGEVRDLNTFMNENSFEVWRYKPKETEFIILNPASTEKELKKFIPELKRNPFGGCLIIPHLGWGNTYVELDKKNVLVEEMSSDGKYKTLYKTDRIKDYVPVDAVKNGESGTIIPEKIPYGEKIKCYEREPNYRVFIPKGSVVEIDGIKETVSEDCIGDAGGTKMDGTRVIGLTPTYYFVEKCKPTEGEKSQEMYNKIKNSVSRDMLFTKSAKGIEFEYVRGDVSGKIKGYKIGNVKFEIRGNYTYGGTMDGYYWDNFEASPEELDMLYEGYKAAINKNSIIFDKKNITVIMDKRTSSISIEH